MTDSPNSVSKAELHAFVDGQLDADRRREVAAYLGAHPEAAATVAAYEAQKKALQAMFEPVLTEPLPARLKPPRARRALVHLAWAATGLILLAAGGLLGWFAREAAMSGSMPQTAVARQAAVAHAVFTPQRRHPVEVPGNEEKHLVRWLSKVLGAPLQAPQLTDLGYALVGGRLLTSPDGPAAQFMYQDAKGQRITLYVVRNPKWRGLTEFRYADENGVAVFYWINGPLGYGLTAKMPRSELLTIANAVYTQLNP
ncbi:MAG: anti-sigma factor [Alphaproteobacteria bacterium]|nr:anti-sigma factor [Alphaproteobacteria bacterium]